MSRMALGGNDRYLQGVHFNEKIDNSHFVRAIRMHFRRDDHAGSLFWDLALEHDNVAVLLYHTEKRCFVLVKQFRPPVFVQRIRQLPENTNKTLAGIDWSNYPISLGETIELCSGMMDKSGKSPLETVHEEIFEECGYNVDILKIEKIKIYLTGVGISGSSQHLFYAEVDDSMKVNEGGGLADEGEFIEKVFLAFDDAQKLLDSDASTDSPPGLLFALSWFFRNRTTGVAECGTTLSPN